MPILRITNRLAVLASYFTGYETLADIGTDHAYLPIYLAKQGGYSKIIATDLNIKPLERAREEIKSHCLDSIIETRQGNGLNCLEPREVQGVAIAGMGGETIRDILASSLDLSKELRILVLQPMTRSFILREWLQKNNFIFLDEELVAEDNHLFEIIVVRFGVAKKNFSPLELEVGPILLEKRHCLLIDQIKQILNKYQQTLHQLTGQEEARHRIMRDQVSQKIEKLEEIVQWLNAKQYSTS